jgi:hypothetical protein
MSLKAEHDGDIMKVPDARLLVCRNPDTRDFVGFYGLCSEGIFIRACATWITATGKARQQFNGTVVTYMMPEFIDFFDSLDVMGTIPTDTEIAQFVDHTYDPEKSPDNDGAAGVNVTMIRRAWQLAAHLVASRPWLDVSWVGDGGIPGHLVVHDGPFGAALHFDEDRGPTWEPRSLPDVSLAWEDVEILNGLGQDAVVDWVECWGTPAQTPELTEKAATYTLIAHLLDESIDSRWAARPARLVHHTDESADAPDSAFSLVTVFPSLAPRVQWYVNQISSPSWGDGTVWHEPLWLLTRDDQPRLVLDEAGRVHMAADSLSEVLDVMAASAELGWVDDWWSFDLLDALTRVGGGFAGLAALLHQDPGKTLRAVRLSQVSATPSDGTAATDANHSGEVEDSVPSEYRFPSACNDVHHFNTEQLRWLTRTSPGATLGDSHDSIVTYVPIGDERCLLRGETTREAVADYLERTLSGSAPFFVVASSKKVIHRVTVGRDSRRIRGFYLYTTGVHEERRPFAAADGSAFGVIDVWFKLMDAGALLHARGHQRLRVVPTLGDIAPHFHVVLAENIDSLTGEPNWDLESLVLAYSMAQGFKVGGLLVGPDTPVSSVAREILTGTTDKGIGIDWAYAGWYAEMLAEARRLGAIPVSYSDFGTPQRPVWRLGYHDEVPFPPPPVNRDRVGFTDVFPQPSAEKSLAPHLSPPSGLNDPTKELSCTLAALFREDDGEFVGLFAFTRGGIYRREGLRWILLNIDELFRLDATKSVDVSYRFIKAFDYLQAHSKRPDWWLAERMGVFSGQISADERKEDEEV